MHKILSVIILCLFSGCMSLQQQRECEELKEIEAAEDEGRVQIVSASEDDPYTYIIWRNIKDVVIKMARFIVPKPGQDL